MMMVRPLPHHEERSLDGLIDQGCRDLLTEWLGKNESLLFVSEVRSRVYDRFEERGWSFAGFTQVRRDLFNASLNRFLRSMVSTELVRSNRSVVSNALTELLVDMVYLTCEPRR